MGVAGIAVLGGAVGENASFPGVKTVQALAITDATNMIVFDSDGANTGTITMAALTAPRTYTFPDASVTITAGTGVVNTGTPLDNQLAVWTSATAIEGDPNFTWDGSTLLMVGALNMGTGALTTGVITGTSINLTAATNQIVLDSDGTFTGTITMAALSASRTYTYPDGDIVFTAGTLPTLSGTPVDNQVAVWTSATNLEGDADFTFDGTNLAIGTSGYMGWTDTQIHRDAANTFAFYNGTNSQQLNIYDTRTDGSNYERLEISSDGSSWMINSASAGTGSDQDLLLQIGATDILGLTSTEIIPRTSVRPFDNNLKDFGASSTTWRTGYFGTSLQVGVQLTSATDVVILDAPDLGGAGQQDSHSILWTGLAFDSVPHDADWKAFVDVTSNAGASTWTLQSRIDAAGYATRMSVTDAGVATFSGTFTTAKLDLTDPTLQIVLDSDGANTGTITMASLTGSRTWIFPDGNLTMTAGTGVVNSGTPVNNQVAVWTTATAVEGDAGLTWDGSVLLTTGTFTGPTLNLTAATNQIVLDSDGTFTGTQSLATLSANRTYTFPDLTGTIALSGQALTVTNLNLTNATNQIVLDSDGTFTGTFTLDALTVSRTYTFPDKDVTIGSGDVAAAGTPLLNEVAVWNDATTIRGEPEVTYNGTIFDVSGTNQLRASRLLLRGLINQIVLASDAVNNGTLAAVGALTGVRDWTLPDGDVDIPSGDIVVLEPGGENGNRQVPTFRSPGGPPGGQLNGRSGLSHNFDTGLFSVSQAGGGGNGRLGLSASSTQINLDTNVANDGTITTVTNSAPRTWTFPDATGPITLNTGTPVNNQLAVWTSAAIIEGDAGLTWDGSILLTTGAFTGVSLNLTALTNQIVLDSDGTFTGTITMAGLGASRVYTFPDANITVGNVSNTGTPVNNQLAVWTTATVVEGDANLTWDATTLSVTNVTITNDLNLSGGVAHGIEFDNGLAGAADTIDWNAGNTQRSTLDENTTYTFTDPPGPARLVLRIIQDAGGTNTVAWPASVEWEGGSAPVISAGANAVDVVSFYHDGTTYYGSFLQDFS